MKNQGMALVWLFVAGLSAGPAFAQDRDGDREKKPKDRPERKAEDGEKKPEKRDECKGHDEKGLFEKLRERMTGEGVDEKALRGMLHEHMEKHHKNGRCHCMCGDEKKPRPEGKDEGDRKDGDKKGPRPGDRDGGPPEKKDREDGGMKGG